MRIHLKSRKIFGSGAESSDLERINAFCATAKMTMLSKSHFNERDAENPVNPVNPDQTML